jgi:hypothetical protein
LEDNFGKENSHQRLAVAPLPRRAVPEASRLFRDITHKFVAKSEKTPKTSLGGSLLSSNLGRVQGGRNMLRA